MFSLDLPTTLLMHHTYHVPRLSHSSLYDHSNGVR
jgi:hypothetical protein